MTPRKFSAVADVWVVPRPKGSKYHKREWTTRLFSCVIKVDPNEHEERENNNILSVRLEDRKTQELLAIAPYDGEHGITSVNDSARHYVLTLQARNLEAIVGIEFRDSADSIDFSLAIQAFMRKRMFTDRQGWPSWSKRRTAALEHDRRPVDHTKDWVTGSVSSNESTPVSTAPNSATHSPAPSPPHSPRLSKSPPPQEVINEAPQLSSASSSQSSIASLSGASHPSDESNSQTASAFTTTKQISPSHSSSHSEPYKTGNYYQMMSLKTDRPISAEEYLEPTSSSIDAPRLAASNFFGFPKATTRVMQPTTVEFGQLQVAST